MNRRAVSTLSLLACLAASGCQSYFESPWKDELAQRPGVDSPSTTRLRGLAGQTSEFHRESTGKHVALAATTVEHAPLYFEDPFEVPDSGDDSFRLTLWDIGAPFYCGGRWLVNSLAIPVSAVVDPPCATAITDASHPGPSHRVGCAKSCCEMNCGRSGCCGDAPTAQPAQTKPSEDAKPAS